MAPADQPDQQGDDEANEITVCIQMNTDTGEFRVGIEPEGQDEATEEASEDQWLQPAKDIEDALRQARDLIEGKQGNPVFDEYAKQSNARLAKL